MFKKKRHIFILLFFLLILVPFCFFVFFYYTITRDAATRIERGAVDRIIASESPAFYDDGHTPIGVFFEKTHRKYIRYQEIPKHFIKALIAAEDRNFFNHPGFDLKAILRALLANIKAGKVVQGGSTLTQQTAKNIFKREKRSYRAKLKELIQSFLFERKYSKQEILEMYSNQFFVTGYGKGLGIAAQYYFDKDPKNLDLVESAFVAGSVKGPNRYNPFIKKSEAEKNKAKRLARLRKDYVLSNMLKANFITKDQYQKAKEREIPFKEGKITYRLNVILDYIREQLESDYFRAILEEQGVDNPAISGMKIYTSINKDIQEAALKSLRTHLPVMDVKLNGYGIQNTADSHKDFLKNVLKKPQDNLPFLARITQIDAAREKGHLIVSWDKGGGIIDYEGLKPIGDAWLKWRAGNWAVFDKKNVAAFLKIFHTGDLVPVRLMVSSNGIGKTKLMLSRIPELEGGVIVLQGGMIRAMAGGFFNRFFNRAVDAKRQLGSIFKPILYTAALQLKWNSLDRLQNMKDLFRFENTFYVPRPDHSPKSEWVSMAWAGAKSENLATVWLLYHLTDYLNMNEFRQVTDLVGLGRKEEESYLSYKKRIRDKHGVVVNREALMEAAFEQSKKEIESDIIFGGHEGILDNLKRLHFSIDGKRPEQILRFSFKRLQGLNLKMKEAHEMMKKPEPISVNDVLIDGLVTSGTIDLLQEEMKKNYRRLVVCKRYDPEVLFRVRDFRTLVNLSYVVYLSKHIGISTKLDPVLSFPLGPNSISIMEAALAYQTIMTGHVYPLSPDGGLEQVPIITKIVDREGEVLWEYNARPEKVLSDRISRLITEILRNVMEIGTGRKAKDAVRVFDIPIPTFGKTGTANRFTNSSFVGFVPGPAEKSGRLDIDRGYVIASYVGYDDNRPMKGKHIAIYGASGALPLWIDTANALVSADCYTKNLQPADLAFEPVQINLPPGGKDIRTVPVSPITGLPEGFSDETPGPLPLAGVVSEVKARGDTWELKRRFEPLKGKTK
ncbi:MAG: transglycosylase domain-containing protein [Deltaproteobacteria bacterium]|nr:transglycosylase domain-containing protein [Deltaproteobacteria bacterium]MBW2119149.1 transglycosylase domain-containing protein [Deltaproteobacteria bacterium]MBW2342690.1 transglycosylase domain-containing protein [Deltaproteobacteria bacterium]